MPHPPVRVTIDRLSYGPAGVGRVGGKVVFVPDTVPGDEVDIAIDDEKKTYVIGHVVAVHHPSVHRRQPPCPYVGRCGGCPWQQVSYGEQLRAKEALVREQLRRIGGLADPPVLPILPSPQEWGYRHRIRLHVDAQGRLGLRQASSHMVTEIDACLTARDALNARLADARAWLAALHTPVGEVELAGGDAADPRVVLIGKAEGPLRRQDDAACHQFLRTHPGVSAIVILGNGWSREWGDSSVTLDLGVDGITLQVRGGAFTQVSPAGNRLLVATVLALAEFRPEQRVIELYCGAGNFSLPVARRVRALVGIEQNPAAVAAARGNAARAGLGNVRFVRAAARRGLQTLLREGARAEVVVLDPPRGGAADVIDALPRVGAGSVVYVSCDPATLARDLRRLRTHGYAVRVAQPLDLFPHTYHVETVTVADLTC